MTGTYPLVRISKSSCSIATGIICVFTSKRNAGVASYVGTAWARRRSWNTVSQKFSAARPSVGAPGPAATAPLTVAKAASIFARSGMNMPSR